MCSSDLALLATTTAKAVEAAAPVDVVPETTEDAAGPANMFEATEGRWGSREIEITDVALLDQQGTPSFVFHTGDPMTVRLGVTAHAPSDDFVFGVGLFSADGVCCYGTNTLIDAEAPRALTGTGEVCFDVDPLDLVSGSYRLDVAVHQPNGTPYDYHRLLYSFRVTAPRADVGIQIGRAHV